MLQYCPSLVLFVNKKSCGAEPTAGRVGGSGAPESGRGGVGGRGRGLTPQRPLPDGDLGGISSDLSELLGTPPHKGLRSPLLFTGLLRRPREVGAVTPGETRVCMDSAC